MQEIKDEITNDPMAKIKREQAAEAFIEMGEQLEREEIIPPKPSQEERVRASIVSGPKYMDALSQIEAIADIRSLETQLPVLKVKAEVAPLSSAEEVTLKSLAVTPDTFVHKVNEILFKHTTFKDLDFRSYKEFLSNLFPPDKAMLMWALLTATYITLPTFEKVCESCKSKYLIDASPADLIHEDSITKIWNEDESPATYTITQDVLNGYMVFEIGMPSEKDKLTIMKLIQPNQIQENIEATGEMFSFVDGFVFFIKSIIVGTGADKIILTDLVQDIYPFMKNLPPKIIDEIQSKVNINQFDDYMPNFYLNATCTNCGHKEKIENIDPELQFFRKSILS
jgi:hypothetical protein